MDGNDRERVRRFYLQKGLFQPKMIFPKRQCGERDRRFVSTWFNDHPSWLEYSVSEDSCYCLFCYLFKPEHGGQSGGDVFVTKGFTNWKEAVKKFRDHVGDINSIHHKCMRACQDLMHEKQHIEIVISNQSEQTRIDYHTRLVASVDVVKLCLIQALAFRGHDESEDSTKKGEAVKVCEDLELWDTAIYSYCLLEKKASTMELIKKRLAERPSDSRLWCSLGDVTNDDACYEKALEVSENRSARAKVIHHISCLDPTILKS
ncbi:Zinc finger MYM-type protein [Heracleum sosnowskyi]|uniref:Zinc finger MYM-type protein n=1 Tax=Heracleum sosnowskyi TaxID=360622 RepID=A0AAD8IV47_9APIA|nr:Zinc finger MYM-type protein [Heracleum sosnowskyi]